MKEAEEKVQKKISIRGLDHLKLFGFHDQNLRRIENDLSLKITARDSELVLSGQGENVEAGEKVLSELISLTSREQDISGNTLETLLTFAGNSIPRSDSNVTLDDVILYKKEGFIKPKTDGQRNFYQAARENDIVFSIGQAGTGKTYLAVAIAIAALKDRLVDRIILTRPAVEAGERLGYLPGDFREKIDPYLRPLYDALNDMIPSDKLKRYLESGIIEIAPLAYMRGRTLNNAFVILDEAQNTSFNQMKMFLTRLGINSKAIITGDVTQIDLPDKESSGLVQIQSILLNIEGIKLVYMTERDVVRHKLVRDIIKAYDDFQVRESNKKNSIK